MKKKETIPMFPEWIRENQEINKTEANRERLIKIAQKNANKKTNKEGYNAQRQKEYRERAKLKIANGIEAKTQVSVSIDTVTMQEIEKELKTRNKFCRASGIKPWNRAELISEILKDTMMKGK